MIKRALRWTVAALALWAIAVPAYAGSGTWIKVTKNVAAFQPGTTTTGTATIYTTKSNEIVEKVIMRLNTVFAGGSVSAATISVGKSGSTTKYVGATNVFTGASVTFPASCTVGTVAGIESANLPVTATLLTTTDNVANLTTGQVTFYIQVSQVPPG